MASYRRRHYLINKKYQIRYTIYILASMIAVAVLISAVTFSVIYPMLSAKLSKAVTEAISKDISRGLLITYWTGVAVLIAVAAVFGILFSHRIVGPINRMTALVNEIKQGNLSKKIILREKDEFYPLANAINDLLDELDETVAVSRQKIGEFAENLEKIRAQFQRKNAIDSDTDKKFESMISDCRRILSELSKYRT
ncbi:MAG: HAMP domain-containing protein [Elusimicrobia bacterium]|nr:HAMP domain-containing protein [Elusimicrobiota bacterium]